MSSQKHPFIVASRGRNPQNPKSRKSGLPTEQMLEPNLEGISNTLTSVEKDNYLVDNRYKDKGRVYKHFCPALNSHGDISGGITTPLVNGIRKLMPIECERLMSWKDNWTKFGRDEKGNIVEISDSQRYKMCGNGVVSNVIKELDKYLLCPPNNKE